MSILKYVTRLKRMDDLINRRATGNPDVFAQKLGISRSQLLQDIKELREIGAPILYDDYSRSYYYKSEYTLSPGFIVNGSNIRGGGGLDRFDNGYFLHSWLLRVVIVCCFISLGFLVNAQTVTGHLVESMELTPVPFANVFVNGTSTGTVSSMNGDFELRLDSYGSYEIVVSFVGFETVKLTVLVEEPFKSLGTIKLYESEHELQAISVAGKRDKNWSKQLARFQKVFLGSTKLAESCALLNPWILEFSEDSVANHFVAKADEPIQIRNSALGYKINYHLTKFWSNKLEYSFKGNIQFEEMNPNSRDQLKTWKKNRKMSYQLSYNYLFKSIIDQRVGGSGFMLQVKEKSTNEKANSFGIEKWVQFDTLGIFTTGGLGEIRIKMNDLMRIYYSYGKVRYLSYLESRTGFVIVNRNGYVLNPDDLMVYGDYNSNRLANLLPSDYSVSQDLDLIESEAITANRFLERPYVHLDKPYYYPGEIMWFKGYIKYGNAEWRDSLSRRIFVELISPNNKIVVSKSVKIFEGVFYNDFQLPDTMKAGQYVLRAYTNLNRNFGDDQLYTKDVLVLNLVDRVSTDGLGYDEVRDSLIQVSFDKEMYKTRGKVIMTITLPERIDSDMILKADLSMSVTDCYQVSPVNESNNIKEFWRRSVKVPNKVRLDFPIEAGLTYSGTFINDKNKPEQLLLNFLEVKTGGLMLSETNSKGRFTLTTIDFYDSTKFVISTSKSSKEKYGHVSMANRVPPPILFKRNAYSLPIIKTDMPQRILSQIGLPKDAIQLDEITVKGRRIVQNDKPFRSYGLPDQIIASKDIHQTNVLYSLMKLPGVMVDMASNTVVFTRAATQSINFGGTPLVTIDDVPMGGNSAGEILVMLNPETIESIEVTKRINPLYGSQGANGVIAVYLKHDVFTKTPINPNFQIISLNGFSSPRRFISPEYGTTNTSKDGVDYRSTVYWNPQIKLDGIIGTKVEFFAADLPGKYKVTIEGTSSSGKAIRGIYFVNVDEN